MSARWRAPAPVIRPLESDDLDDLARIESNSYPYPWTRGILADCIRLGCPAFGVDMRGELAGYVIISWGAGEAHLLNLCIEAGWRRYGLGSLLLEHAIRLAATNGCDAMFLEVRPSNAAAARLYERRGFIEVGRRPNYYPADDGREDARVLRLTLAGAPG